MFVYNTNEGDCVLHSDCPWDKKCVLLPLPVSHPDTGSIFVYKCEMRSGSSISTFAEAVNKGKHLYTNVLAMS